MNSSDTPTPAPGVQPKPRNRFLVATGPLGEDDISERVAKFFGWQRIFSDRRREWRWHAPDGFDWLKPPAYATDLNLCAQLEESLGEGELRRYIDVLCDMYADGSPDPNVEEVIRASARNRCLAFLLAKGELR